MSKALWTILTALFFITTVRAQNDGDDKKNYYVTTGGELIFSSASLSIDGNEESTVLRFSPVFNWQSLVHFNKGRGFGYMTGLTFRNIGLIYDVPNSDHRIKARTYNIGIPFAFKLGNMDGPFVYAGYEIEFPLNYKEKLFINEKKEDKFNVWFSDRVNKFQHGFFVGVQLPYGTNLKFKYYLSKFFNTDFTASDGQGGTVQPYSGFDANIFYFSLNFSLLKDDHFYYRKDNNEMTTRR